MNFIKQPDIFYRSSPKLLHELIRAVENLTVKLSFIPVCDARWVDSLENAILHIRNYTAVGAISNKCCIG